MIIILPYNKLFDSYITWQSRYFTIKITTSKFTLYHNNITSQLHYSMLQIHYLTITTLP